MMRHLSLESGLESGFAKGVERRLVSIFVLSLAFSASACSWFGDKDQIVARGPAIGDIVSKLPELEVPERTAQAPTRDEVLAAYEQVYGSIADLVENAAVGKRLADLKMQAGEDQDLEGVAEPYDDAVEMYQSLLQDSVGSDQTPDQIKGQDQILYQLARAYDVQGQSNEALPYLDRLIAEHPDSALVVEARFRRAEIHFSAKQYAQASADYGFVVASGQETPLWQNASYMQGWSQFKLSELDESLNSFFAVVGNITADGDKLESLSTIEKELLTDSLRVITLGLGYLDGPDTLASHMERLDKPSWQFLVYEHLAQDYMANERYLDSVATWQLFVDRNPLDLRAPNAHIGMINTLVEADFPSEVRPKKAEFIRRYGATSEFWLTHNEEARADYVGMLKVYLTELASLAHSEAQSLKPGSRKGKRAFLAAADWYEEIVATFPKDPAVAEQLFLLGEVYTEAQEHGQAVAAYQRVSRDFPDFARANEASYAAILGLDALVASSPKQELELWQRLKVDAQIEFAVAYPTDARAPSVQADAANSLFELQQYAPAMELAKDSLARWPALPTQIAKTNLLILGHGSFALVDYVAAEQAYQQLMLLPLAATELAPISERLLATVYKQGEIAEAAGEGAVAAEHYLRIKTIDPTSPLAAQGHYDAIAVVEATQDYERSAQLLREFRTSYPNHELGKDIDLRLATLFERSENWREAALEYVNVARGSGAQDVRRQSLYRAAELFEEMQDLAAAQTYYREYIGLFPKPYDAALEAVQKLDEFALSINDSPERHSLLQKKIEIHRSMGRAATPRATYLAAEAQLFFADHERSRFDAIALRHPLKASLKDKTKSLKATVKAYERVAGYKVAEFASASTYHIASLYSGLSRSIMASDRPAKLSELELEQYEILLEEQAYPFEEQAITLHEINMRRSWEGVYDSWVKLSFAELSKLMPARFDKQERQVVYVESIY